MNLDSLFPSFIAESREVLDEMETGLLGIETAPDLSETVNAIFRAAHTIKGSAGIFNLAAVVEFTHVVESVLDRVRTESQELSPDLIALLLKCCDHIRALVDRVAHGGGFEADEAGAGVDALAAESARLLEELRPYVAATEAEAETGTKIAPPALRFLDEEDASPPVATALDHRLTEGWWHISLRFGRNAMRSGFDPLSFIRYLERVGRISGLVTLPDPAGLVMDMNPESCFLGFEIALESAADQATIEGVFDFVRDDCRITVLPPGSGPAALRTLAAALGEDPARLAELWVACGSASAPEVIAAPPPAVAPASLPTAAAAPPPGMPGQAGHTAPATPPDAPPDVPPELARSSAHPLARPADAASLPEPTRAKPVAGGSIRVDADKLDHLINLVGELIIAAARTDLVGRRTHNPDLQGCTSTLSSLVQDVRDSALQLRMVKIAATFSRFQRVVHDLARELGKDIGLVLSGEDTELDKTVVEKLSDPLMHLVRNAIDHGIEAEDRRRALGKPPRGTVKLNAFHDSGSIVIEVSDDGGGLKRDRILAKAVERGLVEPGRPLGDPEVFALIFEPGFSTADQVTNLSGRGVGMDVVKRNILALRGSVDITSAEGRGTTVSVRVPLTLAIINGFLVGIGASVYVIPLDVIEECLEFTAEPGHDFTNLRGRVLPVVRLRDVFQLPAATIAARRESIVVVNCGGRRTGLVVDTLLGEFQTVIKPLGDIFDRVTCVGGSTILGNGEVALILDVAALVEQARENARPSWRSDQKLGSPGQALAPSPRSIPRNLPTPAAPTAEEIPR
jgi:two-component system chemotaxis sensor kinase CheA